MWNDGCCIYLGVWNCLACTTLNGEALQVQGTDAMLKMSVLELGIFTYTLAEQLVQWALTHPEPKATVDKSASRISLKIEEIIIIFKNIKDQTFKEKPD